MVTGALSAYAGRDEMRHSSEPMWRTEAFLAYGLFVGLVLLPTVVYFYVFHGDWFLFYWVDTGRAPWVWGLVAVSLSLGASFLGFRLDAALCRASRDAAARRTTLVAALNALDGVIEQTEDEDTKKPLTDQAIVNLLKSEGVKIARRTVAKYRDQLGILPARMRKRV